MINFSATLEAKLLLWRLLRDISANNLAKKLGFWHQSVNRWACGNRLPSPDNQALIFQYADRVLEPWERFAAKDKAQTIQARKLTYLSVRDERFDEFARKTFGGNHGSID